MNNQENKRNEESEVDRAFSRTVLGICHMAFWAFVLYLMFTHCSCSCLK